MVKWLWNRQKFLIFEITQRCNQDCLFCYNVWKGDCEYPKGELSTDEVKRMLEKVIKETRCKLITISGGEPCLRDDLIEIISFVASFKVSVNLITNGSLLTEEIIKAISKKVSFFELQLLGLKDAHNQLAKSNSFDRVIEAIANIKSYGGRVVCVFVANKLNISSFKETIELAFALGVNGIMFNRFNPGGEGIKHIKELLLSRDELKDALDIANNAVTTYGIPISCSIPIQPCLIDTSLYKKLRFGFCSACGKNSYYTIDPLGNIRVCNHSGMILGNLFNNPFFDIISNDNVRIFSKAIPEFCQGCKKAKKCQGGCKASAEVVYGSPLEEEPFLKASK